MNSDSRITRAPPASPAPAPPQKQVLRKALASVRAALDNQHRSDWDQALCAHLLAWCERHAWPALGVYLPIKGEPDLRPAYAALAARGVRLCLPVVTQKDAPLAYADWQPGEALVKDGMGVGVPAALRLQAMPPALLVPCLGFNRQRLRLGYGGGYYDRTLAALPRPATAGIAYACLAAEFDGDLHDIALDTILTEEGPV